MKLDFEIAHLVDKYLPPDGMYTEREKARIELNREILKLVMFPPDSLKPKLTELLVNLENRIIAHNNGSWMVKEKVIEEYQETVIYLKRILEI